MRGCKRSDQQLEKRLGGKFWRAQTAGGPLGMDSWQGSSWQGSPSLQIEWRVQACGQRYQTKNTARCSSCSMKVMLNPKRKRGYSVLHIQQYIWIPH